MICFGLPGCHYTKVTAKDTNVSFQVIAMSPEHHIQHIDADLHKLAKAYEKASHESRKQTIEKQIDLRLDERLHHMKQR
jgi:formate-dependent nitrite reductase cytochrome c552 subunit